MSDLLSPILYVMENEVDAFWCFALYMDQMVNVSIFSLTVNFTLLFEYVNSSLALPL